MTEVTIQNSNNDQIHSVEEWFKFAPPKRGIYHWKDGRSSKELAKAWFRTGKPQIPEELNALLKSHSDVSSIDVDLAMPEVKTPLDNFFGETRNHDLILIGHSDTARVLIGIEAKADESFGETIKNYLTSKEGTSSNAPRRIKFLSQSIFGYAVDEQIGNLRYQLLHGLGGTLIEAKNHQATKAIFVIYEFTSSQTKPRNLERNRNDFEKFIQALPIPKQDTFHLGKLFGPIDFPGGEFVPGNIPAYIGKISVSLKI